MKKLLLASMALIALCCACKKETSTIGLESYTYSFTSSGGTQTVTASDEDEYLRLSSLQESGGSAVEIKVSGSARTATIGWLTATEKSGTILLKADANKSGSSRSAILKVTNTDGNDPVSVKITQSNQSN